MPANKTATQASPTPVPSAAVQRSEHQRDIVNRLRRIEGQVRALAEMVDAGRPCEDIAQQMSAARKAMDKAFYRMMACSMLEAVTQGDSIEGVERSTRILEKYA
ncbi:metal-sensitive transcriptional regulator [Malikia granosa]|uniref:Transcriptional regulator n=1 Tax=Malikia granosa TaxID=263067 RepID=A0A2S9K8Z5_9BURK|nr:metal-sensitive transcriptional regulator [Malikia granosa]PRD66862.1 transcriptional regulator [Malikia granosa]